MNFEDTVVWLLGDRGFPFVLFYWVFALVGLLVYLAGSVWFWRGVKCVRSFYCDDIGWVSVVES